MFIVIYFTISLLGEQFTSLIILHREKFYLYINIYNLKIQKIHVKTSTNG